MRPEDFQAKLARAEHEDREKQRRQLRNKGRDAWSLRNKRGRQRKLTANDRRHRGKYRGDS